MANALKKVLTIRHDVALSFSGCGFIGAYHFGVLSCFSLKGKSLMDRVRRTAGASAGSLVAALVILNQKRAKEALAKLYDLANEVNRLRFGAATPGFVLHNRLTDIIDSFVPSDISPVQNRLFVSLSTYPGHRNRMVSQYSSRDYLVSCLAASCFIPFYSTSSQFNARRPLIDNAQYIDGGFSNNLPQFDDIPTITVSPFSGSAVISPKDNTSPWVWNRDVGNQLVYVNIANLKRGLHALFPPTVPELEKYYEAGFEDAQMYLQENNFIETEKALVTENVKNVKSEENMLSC